MKKFILTLFICFISLCSYSQLRVYSGDYYESSTVKIQFRIENCYNNPVWVNYIKVKNLNKNSVVYYSNDAIIINSNGGSANAWNSSYEFTFECNNNDGYASIFRSKYEVEICYAEVYDGAKLKIDRFYTTTGVGIELQTTAINNIKYINDNNKFYDLSGKIIEHPIKGKIYICNGKKVVY